MNQSTYSPRLRLNAVQRSVLEGVAGSVPRIRTPFFYIFALLLVALVMILLLWIYFAVIAAIGVWLYNHATTGLQGIKDARSVRSAFVQYLFPLILGLVMIAVLVKPLFAPPGSAHIHPRRLKPEEEPLLYAYVAKISEVINAPKPLWIQVDSRVNASAGVGRGVLGFLRGGVILTLGLPLVSGLKLQGLGGIIAHELGHFNQGVGMRLRIVVSAISHWFGRIVYERDAWDEKLETTRRATHSIIGLLVVITLQISIWLVGRFVWVLMVIGRAASCFLLRQAEFDADLRAIHFSGSDAFERSFDELNLLAMARGEAIDDLNDAWRQRQLGDDFAAMVMHRRKPLSPDQIPPQQPPRRTMRGLFDTHPADSLRMRRSRTLKAAGIYHDQRPASLLFADYPALCKQISLDFYIEEIGAAFRPENLIPSEKIAALQAQKETAALALQRFFFNYFSPFRPLIEWGEYIAPPEDPLACARLLKQTRERLEALSPTIGIHYEAYALAWQRHMNGHWLLALHKAQCRTSRKVFAVPMQGPDDPEQFLHHTANEKLALAPTLETFELELRTRLYAALRLLHTPQVAQRLPQAESLRAAIQPAIDALAGLSSVRSHFEEIMGMHFGLKALLAEYSTSSSNEQVARRILAVRGKLHRYLMDLFKNLTPIAYPFDHGTGKVSMAHYCLNPLPDPEDVANFYFAVSRMIDKLLAFQEDATAQLAHTAEQVEAALGLKPMRTEQLRSGKYDY